MCGCFRLASLLLLSFCIVACDDGQGKIRLPPQNKKQAKSGLNPEREAFAAEIGEVRFFLEVADTPQLAQMGLMHRKSLRPDHGMLFFFDPPRRVSFWMRNTLIPLSIAFLDARGRILEIVDLQPLDERVVFSSSSEVRYAIEMSQGWFDLKGVGIGDVVDLSGIPLPDVIKPLQSM